MSGVGGVTISTIGRIAFCIGLIGAMPAGARQTLVYCDSSVLTDSIANAWVNVSNVGGQATLVRDSARFVDQLWSTPWNRVVLVGHSTSNFAVAGAALTDFAQSNPGVTVVILLLDNRFLSTDSYANADVPIATTTWYGGFWATRITRIVSGDPVDHQTQSGIGFNFPSFAGIEVLPPIGGGNAAPGGVLSSDGARGEAQTPCQQCQLDYENDLVECNTDRDDYVSMCEDVYGPNAQPPQTPNPTEYQACLTTANTNHTNCISAATSRLKLCRKLHQCDAPPPKR